MKLVYPFLVVLALGLFGCNAPTDGNKEDAEVVEQPAKRQLPELLTKALVAHGGLGKWQKYGSLKYQIRSSLGGERQESQLIDLHSRKVRVEASNYTLGMDGQEVWVSPNLAAFGELSPRFYHNLVFYFLAIPFVFADEGAIYEELGEREIEGKRYQALKVTYQAGTGDSPEDFYIAHFNPETYQLELLLYTVTYFSGEKTTQYNSLLYPNWANVGGLLLPTVMEGHKFANDSIGSLRYRIDISNFELEELPAEASLFTMPAKAEVDTVIAR